VENSYTKQFGGTGLGLAISQRLVQLMQGTIWVESDPGEGTSFFFTSKFGVGLPLPLSPELMLDSARRSEEAVGKAAGETPKRAELSRRESNSLDLRPPSTKEPVLTFSLFC
jgi:hypothetical protein